MKKSILFALAVLTMAVSGGAAEATSILVNCASNALALQQAVAANPNGATLQITGFCTGNFTMNGGSFVLVNSTGSNTVSGTDGIIGEVRLIAVRITFNGLTLTGNAADQPGTIFANLRVETGSDAFIENCTVQNSQRDGIDVERGGTAVIQNTTITNNGLAGIHTDMNGLLVFNGASAFLGGSDGNLNPIAADEVTISGNQGIGLVAAEASSVRMYGGTINNNGLTTSANAGNNDFFEVAVTRAGSARLIGVTVQARGASPTYAAVATLASSLYLEKGTSVSGPSGGILASGSSNVFLSDATLSSTANVSTTGMALQANNGSSINSAGNNSITNTTANGVALQVDHGSNFIETNGVFSGFTAAGDTISGLGIALTQSTMDLGTGATPSTWNGSVVIQGNSSLRMSGGMTVTGQVLLKQGSNAAFNLFNGGSNAVNGGVTCPATAGDPAAHVAGPTLVTPNVTVGTNPATTTPPTCLAF